jgi:uncharacterized protein YxjI
MENKFVTKFSFEIKEIFEEDYHLIDDDEELVNKFIKKVRSLQSTINKLEHLQWEMEDEIYDLKFQIRDYERKAF